MIVDIPITAMKLINKYQNTNQDSPYLFPILSGPKTGEDLYTEYQPVSYTHLRPVSPAPSAPSAKPYFKGSYVSPESDATDERNQMVQTGQGKQDGVPEQRGQRVRLLP